MERMLEIDEKRNILRNLSVSTQKRGSQEGKENSARYDQRWVIERYSHRKAYGWKITYILLERI